MGDHVITGKPLNQVARWVSIFRGGGRGREKEREKHGLVVSLIRALIGCFLYVPRTGNEPSTLAHKDQLSHLARA